MDHKNVVLGVSSSISLYKACEIVRLLQKRDLEVQVIMTPNAGKLISPRLFQALTGRKAFMDLFEDASVERVAHIDLAREAGLFLVAPATANVIGKFATGIADDFLTTFYLAATCPVVVAPAMNENMYLHAQTQENMSTLKGRGVRFVLPGRGRLACGDEGWGRLAQPEEIVEASLEALSRTTSLEGKKVLVTAGPTREAVDPVRYFTNRSTGRMGYALAEEAVSRGAEVTLVSGPASLPVPVKGDRLRKVETAAEMETAVLELAGDVDIVVMAAAVADFRPAHSAENKIKKAGADLKIDLVRTSDILAALGKCEGGPVLIGFAAETESIEDNARAKLQAKNLDMVVANDVSRPDEGFGSDTNRVFVLTRDGRSFQTEKMSKREISRVIFNEIEGIIAREKSPAAP
jgi:phosphopantothenoylcysteine decarboxylase/phosphopantothenate--cysteine ligase